MFLLIVTEGIVVFIFYSPINAEYSVVLIDGSSSLVRTEKIVELGSSGKIKRFKALTDSLGDLPKRNGCNAQVVAEQDFTSDGEPQQH